jgi:hypothetical protein
MKNQVKILRIKYLVTVRVIVLSKQFIVMVFRYPGRGQILGFFLSAIAARAFRGGLDRG